MRTTNLSISSPCASTTLAIVVGLFALASPAELRAAPDEASANGAGLPADIRARRSRFETLDAARQQAALIPRNKPSPGGDKVRLVGQLHSIEGREIIVALIVDANTAARLEKMGAQRVKNEDEINHRTIHNDRYYVRYELDVLIDPDGLRSRVGGNVRLEIKWLNRSPIVVDVSLERAALQPIQVPTKGASSVD